MAGELRYAEAGEIGAPIETVFDYRLDYARTLPEYNPNVTNIRRTDGGSGLGPGAYYVFDLTLEGMGSMEAMLEVLQVERPTRIVQKTGSGMFVDEVCTFTPTAGGTRVEFAVTMELPDGMDEQGLAFLESSGRGQLRLELEIMKKVLEG